MTKGILYYTDNLVDEKLTEVCRKTLLDSKLPITSVSLKPIDFGNNIVLPLERSYETLFTQILVGLEAMTEDIIYFCEHDVLYHPNHFDFRPTEEKFYYNGNYYFLRGSDGFAIHYNVSPLSGLVAFRQPLINHFKERLELIKKEGFSRRIGFEPFTHKRIKWNTWYDFEVFLPKFPNVDVTHKNNTTWKRWRKDQFRRQPKFWEESDIYHIPGWENLSQLLHFKPLPTPVASDKSLSIVIPARNEEFVGLTVENLLQNIEGNTNIIVGLDGYTVPIPDIPKDERVIIINYNKSIGQRAITNQCVRLSQAKYVAKVDAHCSFDKGFDVKLMEKMQDNYTMVPIMRNLHAFSWRCKKCGHEVYQSPTPGTKNAKIEKCPECSAFDWERVIKWIGKKSPQSTSYRFDSTLHFQYFQEYKKRPEYKEMLKKEGLTESLSLQGSFFMLTRDKYWELDVCEESFGSWGQQGTEVACKTWLSGGRVVCNHNTWYAHMFRTQGGDFSFPYPQSNRQVREARKYSRELFKEGKWTKAKYDLQWLLDKFAPVPDWDK